MPVQTTATLNVKTKGAVEASQQAAKISKTAAAAAKDQLRNTKDVEKELERLQGRLKDVARHQIALNKAMEGVEKGSKVYKQLSGQLREVNKQQTDLERSARGVERAFKGQAQAAGSFTQGLMQGAGAMQFLQRGPGMRRQAAGMALGRMGRGVLGGVAQMPFGGMQSLVQGLQSIPFAGALAAPIARAMGQAQQAVQYHQVRLGAMPFLGGLGLRERAAVAGRRAAARVAAPSGVAAELQVAMAGERARAAYQPAERPEAFKELSPAASRAVGAYGVRGRMAGGPSRASRMLQAAMEGQEKKAAGETAEDIARIQVEFRHAGARRRAGAEARAEVRREALGGIGPGGIQALGVRYGMALPQVTQFGAGVSRAAGGVGVTRQAQRLRETAIAAQVGFQVDPGVAGAFGLGGRRGGLVGGGGRAAESMVEAMQDATKLGLEGSELNDYLQQIADGIVSWKSTGIPFNKASMMELSTSLGATIGGVRGMRIAGAARQMGIQMGRQGPGDLGELLAFRAMTGIKAGATQEEIWQAKIRAQEQKFEPGGVWKGIKAVITGAGGGVRGLRAAEPLAAKFGYSTRELTERYGLETEGLTPARAKWMGETPAGLARAVKFMGGGAAGRGAVLEKLGRAGVSMTEEEMLAKLEEAPTVGVGVEALEAPEALARAARGAVPGTLREMAKLTNLQIRTGETIALDLKKIDASVQKVAKEIIEFLKPVFAVVGIKAEEITAKLGTGVEGVEAGPP